MGVTLLDESLLDDVREGITMHLAPLNIGQYHQMIRDGILHDGEPIELGDALVVEGAADIGVQGPAR